ncbi:NAD+ kinase [Hathewaya proteolytica DSM 3090]|uniref:NAD kinase n=1 Tax=Hathewaya proteolytica DSM 3090 TaxID=1121331 RepID=A0A1M6L444_9CLOT|nr:NAD(+)/NADH kinase [Hathewaya proteolytica]SHJ65991.1 NAD+ kinase [Hathewaya proteolytica DSM 3090]
MKNIGINVNRMKDKDETVLNMIKSSIKKIVPDCEIFVLEETNHIDDLKKLHMVISLGGDGTILSTCRLLQPLDIPVFGVNIGNLGFLTSCDLNDFEEEFKKVLCGECSVDSRMLLEFNINNGETYKYRALNDIVICKGTLSRIIEFTIYIDDEMFTTFKADGIIISTPTGSTAYSLSSGGPIMCPLLDVISITPICPQLLGMRTLVAHKDSDIKIWYKSHGENVFITVDGQCSQELQQHSFVNIKSSSDHCRLITTENYSFFKVLSDKIINNK